MLTQEQLLAQLIQQGKTVDGISGIIVGLPAKVGDLQKTVAALRSQLADQDSVSPELQAAADAMDQKLSNLAGAASTLLALLPDASASSGDNSGQTTGSSSSASGSAASTDSSGNAAGSTSASGSSSPQNLGTF